MFSKHCTTLSDAASSHLIYTVCSRRFVRTLRVTTVYCTLTHLCRMDCSTSTFWFKLYFICIIYSRLSLSQIPRDSLKYFETSVPRHIRVERVRKTTIWTITFNKWMCNLTPEVRNIYMYNNVEKRRNCSLGAISPLFHIILLPVVIVSC